ncbi:helix-turn-helix domain-containing protein [Nonomuraea sp. NPDC050536]
MHPHPNTVGYRLREVARLTSLDPTDDAHVQRLGAALVARRTV